MAEHPRNLLTAVKTASYYDRLWTTSNAELHYTEMNRIDFIVRNIRTYVGESRLKILDFGCGRGWMAPFLSPLGEVVGIDFSPSGIRCARERYSDHSQFVLADIRLSNLGLPEGLRFDVVVCSEVIEHVPDHLMVLKQIAGFLRGEGWCMLTTPNGNVWPRFSQDERFRAQLQPVENWVGTGELQRLLKEAGFRVEIHEGRPMYDFRVGIRGWLQFRMFDWLLRNLRLYGWYGRTILPTALYQVVAAQKLS